VADCAAAVLAALLVEAAVVLATLADCVAALVALVVAGTALVAALVLALSEAEAVVLPSVAVVAPPQAASGVTIATPPAAKRNRRAFRRECREPS
jgi:hypothetical protein